MLTPEELNQIIKELRCLNEHPDIPYTKGMIDRNGTIKILKKFTNCGETE